MAADNYTLTLRAWRVIIHLLAAVVLETGQPETLGVQEFQTGLGSVHCLYFSSVLYLFTR